MNKIEMVERIFIMEVYIEEWVRKSLDSTFSIVNDGLETEVPDSVRDVACDYVWVDFLSFKLD